MVKLSIIIINYRSLESDPELSTFHFQFQPMIAFEIIIVNNDESLWDGIHFNLEFPELRWIDMHYNAGFARANNEGIRQSMGEAVLIAESGYDYTAKCIR